MTTSVPGLASLATASASQGEHTIPPAPASNDRAARRWTSDSISATGRAPDPGNLRIVEGRQDRHRQNGDPPVRRPSGRLDHPLTPRRVHGKEPHVQVGGGADRSRDRVGDIVELQVEKDVLPSLTERPYHSRAARSEQLEPHLIEGGLGAKALDQLKSGIEAVHVEGDDDPVVHDSEGTGRGAAAARAGKTWGAVLLARATPRATRAPHLGSAKDPVPTATRLAPV